MRTPRESFTTSRHFETFVKIVSSEAFEPACQAALLQLQFDMPPTYTPKELTDPYCAIDANSQMFGAQRIIQILYSFAEPPKPEKPLKRESLNYAR